MRIRALALVAAALAQLACGTAPVPPAPAEPDPPHAELAKEAAVGWTGDLDGMLDRRVVRVLCPMSPMFYAIGPDGESGATYEIFRAFEAELNKGRGALRVHVVFIPTSRDRLLPALVDGHGDVAVGNLTITDARRGTVDFTNPVFTGVDECLVTGPASPAVASLDDLAGKEVVVRASSSYFESLKRLSDRLVADGKAPITITPADENLQDEDLLEMVNAGLYPLTVMDAHMADFWAQVFDKLSVHHDLTVATGGEIAWAIRKESPKLAEALNGFIAENGKGKALGNTIFQKYLKDTKWARNANDKQELAKFTHLQAFFKKYGREYDLEWLLVAAQGYQESRLDQSVRSPVGAVGVMQVLPSTAADKAVNIPNVVTSEENNIHAGAKYMRWVIDRNFGDPRLDRVDAMLFALASYNAGPARMPRFRQEAAERGLDPNKWFYNVELIVAEEVGRETVQYVSNIYKYYVTYKRYVEQGAARDAARRKAGAA
jgi:membrane-bound lytic murein transglycosylase MltF